jgi:hypothetical protein
MFKSENLSLTFCCPLTPFLSPAGERGRVSRQKASLAKGGVNFKYFLIGFKLYYRVFMDLSQ